MHKRFWKKDSSIQWEMLTEDSANTTVSEVNEWVTLHYKETYSRGWYRGNCNCSDTSEEWAAVKRSTLVLSIMDKAEQRWPHTHHIIIITIIARTMFVVLSSWHSHCESSPGSFDECRLSAGWPPTLRPKQLIWAVSPLKDWLLPSADTIAIYYYYSARMPILILSSHGGWKVEST